MASNQKKTGRRRRQERVRKKVLGTDVRPRVCVFRSNKHIYAQVISDDGGTTLVEAAKQVGLALAKICQEKKITRVVFDRNGFLFHGQVKAVADGAREGGLEF